MRDLQLKVRRVSPTATLPAYQTAGASGLDLHADLGGEHVAPWTVYDTPIRIPTGIAVEIPDGYEGQVRGRSGLAFGQYQVQFYVGTIDADYRGEIAVLLWTPRFLLVKHGDRIAQLVIAPVARCEVVEAADLGETARGSAGFGSTGR